MTGVIFGSRDLPPAFDHPHASDQARQIAERGTVRRGQVGSGVHGTSVTGQDDRDELGICFEPRRFVTGLARVPEPTRSYLRSVRRDSSHVPPETDHAWVDDWLHESYVRFWSSL